MGWDHKIGALERIVEAGAAASLAAAVGVAVAQFAPFAGMPLWAATIAGAVAAAAGALALLRRFGERGGQGPRFEPVEFADATELLLDQPIAPPQAESRVVRLFGARTLPEPGELATRIADYLEAGRGGGGMDRAASPVPSEASAALHAALADIRRSLR